MGRVLLATNNPGKVAELRRLLCPAGIEAVTPAQLGIALDVSEDGATYTGNAFLKAHAAARLSDLVVLADDSGIEVDALDGAPGVRSARFGGPELDDAGRRAALHRALAAIPGPHTARFRAVVAVVRQSQDALTRAWFFEGVVEGRITAHERGAGGFGYDPLFELPDGRTVAELDDAEKDRLSHRGRAVAAALPLLREVTAC